MIYTVTFNPALDYVVKVNHFTLGNGQQNRAGRHLLWGPRASMYRRYLRLWASEYRAGFMADLRETRLNGGVKNLGFQSDFIR